MSKVKTGTGGSLQNEEPVNTGLFLILITVQTLGKEKNTPLLPKSILRRFRCFVCSPSVSRAFAYIPAQTRLLRLCGAHSAARRGTYVSNRALYLRLFLVSLHAFFPPPFLHHVIACQSQQQFECGSFLGSLQCYSLLQFIALLLLVAHLSLAALLARVSVFDCSLFVCLFSFFPFGGCLLLYIVGFFRFSFFLVVV